MGKLARNPARVAEPAMDDARNVLGQGARFRRFRVGAVETVECGLAAERLRCRGKTADHIGRAGRFENVAPRRVADMNEGACRGDATREAGIGAGKALRTTEGMIAGREIGGAKVAAALPLPVER